MTTETTMSNQDLAEKIADLEEYLSNQTEETLKGSYQQRRLLDLDWYKGVREARNNKLLYQIIKA